VQLKKIRASDHEIRFFVPDSAAGEFTSERQQWENKNINVRVIKKNAKIFVPE